VSDAPAPESGWPSFGIVVPVYDEAATIERGCREIVAVAEQYPGYAVAIAVDDGSTDDSVTILTRLARETELLDVQRHRANTGYGAALRTGAARARALGLGYVAFIDSDLTNPPADLLTIGELARAGYDYIKGSRFVPGGSMAAVPLARRVVSLAGNGVARALFGTGVRDVTNGFRAVRTDLFLSWPLREEGFALIVEEFEWALRSGVRTAEFPTVLGARTGAQRASAFPYRPALLYAYVRYPIRALGRRLRDAGRGRS
jgi:glycosyltransferase involved in cell wall biosynthesis